MCEIEFNDTDLNHHVIGFLSCDDVLCVHLEENICFPYTTFFDGMQNAVRALYSAQGDGFGRRYIEAHHGEEIRKAGFDTITDFISYIIENTDHRLDHEDISYLISCPKEGPFMVVKLVMEEGYYNVKDAFFAGRHYLDRLEK